MGSIVVIRESTKESRNLNEGTATWLKKFLIRIPDFKLLDGNSVKGLLHNSAQRV